MKVFILWFTYSAVLIGAFLLGAQVASSLIEQAMDADGDFTRGSEIRMAFDKWCPIASFDEGVAHDAWFGGFPPPKSIHLELILVNAFTYLLASAILFCPLPVIACNARRNGE